MTHGPTRDFGNSQRNFAYQWAHGDWIVHMDDDDIFTEDAFIKIRKAILQVPTDGIFMFKVKAPWGEVVWTSTKDFAQGNLCTIQMVIPNHRIKLPAWPKRQGGNIPFFNALREQFSVSWRSEIIAVCRPQAEDRWF
jgi:glycosyltransferase involved in cell wall biosynthesis